MTTFVNFGKDPCCATYNDLDTLLSHEYLNKLLPGNRSTAKIGHRLNLWIDWDRHESVESPSEGTYHSEGLDRFDDVSRFSLSV
nr:hypothetical protein HmN_000920700 [Hymenolepis microstoma]